MNVPASEVVLARPHPLLVGPISETLDRLGMRGRALTSTREIPTLDERYLIGAIVSAASTSGVKESFPYVCSALREAYPTLPVAITTLMSAAQAKRSLKGLLIPVFGNFDFLDIAEGGSPLAHTPTTRVLLITREDLLQTHRLDHALQTLFLPANPAPIR